MNHFSFFNPKKALMIALMGTMMNICLTALAQIPGYVSPQQLIGWYSFAGNAQDASSAQNHGVMMNATFSIDRFNNPGQALYLSGQSGFVSIPHRPSFNELPLTVSCWVKPSSEFKFSGGPGGGPLITKGIGEGANTWYISTMRGGDTDDAVIPAYTTALPDMSEEGCACGCNGVLEGQGDCGTGINYDGDIFDNAWHMITFSVNHSSGKLYMDGALINEQAWVGEASEIYNTVDLMLGAMQQSGGPWTFYKGFMDEVGIWNRVLSNDEVLALYTGETLDTPCLEIDAAMANDLVGHWPFCGNANDHGPLAAHGTVMGATLVADGLGFAESAYHFENDSITLPVPLDFLNNDFTLHLEAKLSSFDGTPQTLLTSGGLHVFYQEGADLWGNVHVLFNGGGEEIAYTVGFVNPSQWHTITLAQTGGYVMLFINGQFYNEGFYTFSSPITQSNTLSLGRGINGSNNFSGEISNVALWQRALDFEEIIELNEATGLITLGCTDPGACNFDPQANTDDWSCAYPQWSCDDGDPNTINDMYDDWCNCQGIAGDWETGCIDPSACNFDWMAVVDDGSCVYPGSACDDGDPNTEASFINWWCECEEAVECNDYNAINYFPGATGNSECLYMYHLSTFYDANMNGQWDWDEALLPNFPVHIPSIDSILYTDEWGNLYFEWSIANDSLVGNDSIYTEWTPTTPLTFFLDWGYSYGTWGFTPIPTGANAWVNSIWNPIIHCEVGYDGGTDVHNVGLEPLIVVAEFTFDSILVLSLPDPTIATIDSVGTGYFSFISDTLYSLEHFPAVVHIPSPGLEYLDMVFPITVTTTVYDTAGQVVTTSTFNYEPWVACAYDPNDLSAYSGGHYDQNYVLADQRILFKVRFQNTGNLPAEDVLIKDVLNPEVWDLDSFEPVSVHVSNAPTEYFDTDIDMETGEVNFYLDNIYLPDSNASVDASQGYVLFYVNTRSDLAHGTVLNNTAQIYFDSNPPIITNTTTHTIFDCATIQGPATVGDLCVGEAIALNVEQPYVDSYHWSLDDTMLSDLASCNAQPTVGEHVLALTMSNALCEVIFEQEIAVHAAPEVELTIENGLITVDGGVQWQWYFENDLLNVNGAQLTPSAEGSYSVMATDEFGCSTTEEVDYVAQLTAEVQPEDTRLYPNPANAATTLELPMGIWEVVVTDATGRCVLRLNTARGRQQIATETWPPGIYHVTIAGADRRHTLKLITQ